MTAATVQPKHQFEQQHVVHVYNEIASVLNDLQHKAWPNVKRFLQSFPTGSVIADIGCANGRYLNINKHAYKIGIDVCFPLVNNAKEKGFEVGYADNLHIPFRNGTCDGVISVGVIHHFCSIDRRIQAVRELARVLRPGGKLMLYVWAYEQKHRKFDSQDVLIPWHESTREQTVGSASSNISSASSVSEDDSSNIAQDKQENNDETCFTRFAQRRNSVSLDDLQSIKELSDFKPRYYYSLDFNNSSVFCNDEELQDKLVCSKKVVLDKQVCNEKKSECNKLVCNKYNTVSSRRHQNVINECKKLETSLRAMSDGNLLLLQKSVVIDDDLNKDTVNIIVNKSVSVEDMENDFDETNDFSCRNVQTEFSYVRSNGEIEEGNINNSNQNFLKKDDDQETYDENKHLHCDSRNHKLQTDFDHATNKKLDPFLKKVFLEKPMKLIFNANDDNIEEIQENKVEKSLLKEVSVGVKPIIKIEKVKRSFFVTVKTMMLELFMENRGHTRKISRKKKTKQLKTESISNMNDLIPNKLTIKRSNLTEDQVDLAAQLSFKVRQFPLSSCPHVLQNTQLDSKLDLEILGHFSTADRGIYKSHSVSSERQVHLDKCLFSKSLNTKEFDNNGTKCGLFQAFSNIMRVPVNQYNTECESLDLLYDGYMKIDVDRQHTALQLQQNTDLSLAQQTFDNHSQQLNPAKTCTHEKEMALQNPMNQLNAQTSMDRNIYCPSGNPCSRTIDDRASSECISRKVAAFDAAGQLSEFASKLFRYYHVFRKGELESLISSHVTDLRIVQSSYDHANWYVIAEKI